MSPVSRVFHNEVTVSIGLKTSFRVGTSIQHRVSLRCNNKKCALFVQLYSCNILYNLYLHEVS